MSVGCDEGTFRFHEECDEVAKSQPYFFLPKQEKVSANREKSNNYIGFSRPEPTLGLVDNSQKRRYLQLKRFLFLAWQGAEAIDNLQFTIDNSPMKWAISGRIIL